MDTTKKDISVSFFNDSDETWTMIHFSDGHTRKVSEYEAKEIFSALATRYGTEAKPKSEDIQFAFSEWMTVSSLLNTISHPTVTFQNEHIAMAKDALEKCRKAAEVIREMFIKKATANEE